MEYSAHEPEYRNYYLRDESAQYSVELIVIFKVHSFQLRLIIKIFFFYLQYTSAMFHYL